MPKAKAKRRTRKSVSHTNQILPNSNIQASLPSKQISKEDKQLTRQIGVHGVSQISSVNQPVTSISKRQEKLSWVVIFLLVTLISFNVILYVKLWKIDESNAVDIIR